MKSQELAPTAQRIVKELSRRLNAGQISLQAAEQRIVEFVNGAAVLSSDVVEGVREPTQVESKRSDRPASFDRLASPSTPPRGG